MQLVDALGEAVIFALKALVFFSVFLPLALFRYVLRAASRKTP